MIFRLVYSTVFVIWCLNFKQGDAFLEDIREAVGEATDYLKGAVPYVTNLYKKIKQVQEFTDSVIDEECDYSCPPGLSPVPKPGHVGTTNGCGSLNVIFDHTDESPIRLDQEFTPCCDQHDLCYDTCNADKDECDLNFKRCLYRVCKAKKGSELLEVKPCKANARAAFLLVMALGCPLYRDSQKEACICVRKSRRDEL